MISLPPLPPPNTLPEELAVLLPTVQVQVLDTPPLRARAGPAR